MKLSANRMSSRELWQVDCTSTYLIWSRSRAALGTSAHELRISWKWCKNGWTGELWHDKLKKAKPVGTGSTWEPSNHCSIQKHTARANNYGLNRWIQESATLMKSGQKHSKYMQILALLIRFRKCCLNWRTSMYGTFCAHSKNKHCK